MDNYRILSGLPCGILFGAGKTPLKKDQLFDSVPHSHDFYELYFFVNGAASYILGSGMHEMSFGSLVFIQPGQLHSVHVYPPCSYVRYYLYIPKTALNFITANPAAAPLRFFKNEQILQDGVLNVSKENAEDILRFFESIRNTLLLDPRDARMECFSTLLTLLTKINQIVDGNQTVSVNSEKLNSLTSQALRIINADVGAIKYVDDLARQLYVSREYLSRVFSKTTGITLNRYLTMKRVELAKQLLEVDTPLHDICDACGWNDYSYFISLFHKEVGVTPARYRSNLRAQKKALEKTGRKSQK